MIIQAKKRYCIVIGIPGRESININIDITTATIPAVSSFMLLFALLVAILIGENL